jgi:hypothetical protein
MIWASDLTLEALKYSHSINTVVDIYRRGALQHERVPVTAGDITGDRSSKTRLNAKVSLALAPWEATGVDAKLCRFVVRQGVDITGGDGLVKLGEFRVDEVSRSRQGLVALTGVGLEQYVIDARFLTPRTPPYGVSTTGHIKDLINEVLPQANVVVRCTRNKPVQATAPWDRERWDAIDALATSIDAEVFVDHTGDFIIADIPTLLGAPAIIFDSGASGLLVSRKEGETRDRVYNAVSVSGDSSDPAVPSVWGWAYDSDPASDTYYYGAYGQVPRFFSSRFFTTDQQCRDYADSLLAEGLAENTTISFGGLPTDLLEPGDVVGVRRFNGVLDAHLAQKVGYQFGGKNALAVDTLSAKSVITDGLD